jgi:hypothetical protein
MTPEIVYNLMHLIWQKVIKRILLLILTFRPLLKKLSLTRNALLRMKKLNLQI